MMIGKSRATLTNLYFIFTNMIKSVFDNHNSSFIFDNRYI